MSDLITLKEYRRQIETADYDEHAETLERSVGKMIRTTAVTKPAGAAVAGSVSTVAAKAFEDFKSYISKLYENVSSPHSFIDPSGIIFDCLPFADQPAVRAAKRRGVDVSSEFAPPPSLERADESTIDGWNAGPKATGLVPTFRQGLTDAYGNKIAVPPGAVPFRRLSLAKLVRHGSLDRALGRPPAPSYDPRRLLGVPKATYPAAPGPASGKNAPASPGASSVDGSVHRYAAVSYTEGFPISGVSTYLNVWQPNSDPGGESISQLWIKGDPDGIETIESGWQVSPALYGNAFPILFIYYNPDHYNLSGQGFVEGYTDDHWVIAPQAPVGRGSALIPCSSQGAGSQIGSLMTWQRNQAGDWTLYMGADSNHLAPIGKFMAGSYKNLSSQGAQFAMFGGEVASQGGSTATGQMGSGTSPLDASLSNYGSVAFQSHLQVSFTGAETNWGDIDPNKLSPILDPTEPLYYPAFTGTADSWRTYFFFGGGGAP